ncbi:MAG: chlorite dismutase family protein [Phycisphaeraceae bacterium]
MTRPPFELEKPVIDEFGAPRDGEPQVSNERLFMQMLVFTGCEDTLAVAEAVSGAGFEAVIYEDIHDPKGIGLLTFHRDPTYFVSNVRNLLRREPMNALTLRPEYSMLGRTYALGHEADLDHYLFKRPRHTALNPDWPWAIWYPLRRRGTFTQLPADEQRKILMEHAKIGMAYAESDYVHDIRLASHGLDPNDNDFVIGLVGRELAPLSKIVEKMRSTTQTAQYLEKLGPFFVGRAAWRSQL